MATERTFKPSVSEMLLEIDCPPIAKCFPTICVLIDQSAEETKFLKMNR